MPSMRRLGYADSLAAGSIAAGGTLGILIPPSVILIIYGLLTETDIGRLFLAGVLPGLLGVLLYLVAVVVAVKLNPALAPDASEREPLTRREGAGVAAVLALFLFIIGGLYGGLFTPTEAAGMGAAAALVIALALGSMRLADYRAAFLESARTTGMVFAVVIGAEIFANLINFAGLPYELADTVEDAGLGPWTVVLLIVAIYLALGCVLESLSMILLTVPVFYPLVQALDFGQGPLADPEAVLIWFGIVVVVATEISLITPPVGMNVFVMRSVLGDVPLATIFRGVTPFWIADLVRVALVVALPSIALLLAT
jgi:tripartite ATP-independent transporter DctM subunit